MKKLLLLMLVSIAFAANNPGAALKDMLGFVKDASSSSEIEKHVASYVNIDSISAQVAGRKAWLAASKTTRTKFTNKLSSRLLKYYAKNLLSLNKYRFELISRPSSSRQKIQIFNPNGSTSVLVIFYQKIKGKWLIVDSSFNGISIVSYWRSKLQNIIKTSGLLGI